MNAADHWEEGVPIYITDSNGVEREYVPSNVYLRVTLGLGERLADLHKFCLERGLGEAFKAWKASS